MCYSVSKCFFVKQKTAYEMRISDWSSDVCSSDLLLDAWDLNRWHELFTEECRYLVPTPSADPYASPDSTLHIIADDAFLLKERVKRLQKRTAHAEFPH